MTTISELQGMFDDHPSLDASLQDFEAGDVSSEFGDHHRNLLSNALAARHSNSSRPFNKSALRGGSRFPNRQSEYHSAPSDSESEMEDLPRRPESSGGYSPPAWRRTKAGRSSGFWNSHDNVLKREDTPEWQSSDEVDATLAAAVRTRLPSGSLSPEKRRSPSPAKFQTGGGAPVKKELVSPVLATVPEKDTHNCEYKDPSSPHVRPPNMVGIDMRFSVRAEVQHRTEPFERFVSAMSSRFESATRSWTRFTLSIVGLLTTITVLRAIMTPGTPPPMPDLVKVAGLAKAFEPLLFYTENGAHHVGDLQATSIAVWDLGESMRYANLSSGALIVKELDDLSENLKTLSIELIRFFSSVHGDIDSIISVMEWSTLQLAHLPSGPPSSIDSLLTNTHTLLSRMRIFADAEGKPTPVGATVSALFGKTPEQRTTETLQDTYYGFLQVLEEAIESELKHSHTLFELFESIDRQFQNLHRAAARETDAQEKLENEMLSSLWTRVMGSNAQHLRKFEQNKILLRDVQKSTKQNKEAVMNHNGKLQSLKYDLEHLRRKLVSPLVAGEQGRSRGLTVDEQIRGLEGLKGFLVEQRSRQKGRFWDSMYGSRGGKTTIGMEEVGEIEASR